MKCKDIEYFNDDNFLLTSEESEKLPNDLR